jgi:hypothetical protein
MLKKTLAFTCLALSMATTAANAGTSSATDSGWYDSTGFSGTASGTNYIAGEWLFTDINGPRSVLSRNFIVFDLSGVGPASSATLRLDTAIVGTDGIYSLWDVETDVADLSAGGVGLTEIFDDLGTGTGYGSIELEATQDGEIIEIGLNAAALASINASGGLWAIGGKYDAVVGDEPSTDRFVFGNSILPSFTRELVLNPVPIPPAVFLFGSALLGLAGLGRKRQTR